MSRHPVTPGGVLFAGPLFASEGVGRRVSTRDDDLRRLAPSAAPGARPLIRGRLAQQRVSCQPRAGERRRRASVGPSRPGLLSEARSESSVPGARHLPQLDSDVVRGGDGAAAVGHALRETWRGPASGCPRPPLRLVRNQLTPWAVVLFFGFRRLSLFKADVAVKLGARCSTFRLYVSVVSWSGAWRGGRGHCVLGRFAPAARAQNKGTALECGLLGGVDDE